MAPPFVLDNSGNDFFVSAIESSQQTTIQKFTMTDAGHSDVSLRGPVAINLPSGDSYTLPPPNGLETCGESVDTLDGRFQNRSYQYGSSLWQVHTVQGPNNGPPTIKFYQVDTGANSTIQSGLISYSTSSFDFNPSIAANPDSSAVVTWSATQPSTLEPLDPLMVFATRTDATPPNTMVAGSPVAGSMACLLNNPSFYPSLYGSQRWGDYSAVSLDPAEPGVFWASNEQVLQGPIGNCPAGRCEYIGGLWGTHHSRITP
jgi:hypothetical protein